MYFNILDMSVIAFVLFHDEAQNRGQCSSNANDYSWGNSEVLEKGPCCYLLYCSMHWVAVKLCYTYQRAGFYLFGVQGTKL